MKDIVKKNNKIMSQNQSKYIKQRFKNAKSIQQSHNKVEAKIMMADSEAINTLYEDFHPYKNTSKLV